MFRVVRSPFFWRAVKLSRFLWKGDGWGRAETAREAVLEAENTLLRENAVIAALARKDFSGLEALSTGLREPPRIAPYGETPTPSGELYKSGGCYAEKSAAIAKEEDSGEWDLATVLSAQDVLSNARPSPGESSTGNW